MVGIVKDDRILGQTPLREFVEQSARLALQVTQTAVVLNRGRIVHAGDSSSLLADPDKLAELAADYPLPRLLLDYRGIAKLKSTGRTFWRRGRSFSTSCSWRLIV